MLIWLIFSTTTALIIGFGIGSAFVRIVDNKSYNKLQNVANMTFGHLEKSKSDLTELQAKYNNKEDEIIKFKNIMAKISHLLTECESGCKCISCRPELWKPKQ